MRLPEDLLPFDRLDPFVAENGLAMIRLRMEFATGRDGLLLWVGQRENTWLGVAGNFVALSGTIYVCRPALLHTLVGPFVATRCI